MEFQYVLFQLHSGVRWLVVGISLLAAVYFLLRAVGVVGGGVLDRPLMLGFTIGLDIQVLIGLILIVVYLANGAFQGYQIGHLAIMLVAVGVAHMGARLKADSARVRARNNLLVILTALALVFIGVMALAGGLARWGIVTA